MSRGLKRLSRSHCEIFDIVWLDRSTQVSNMSDSEQVVSDSLTVTSPEDNCFDPRLDHPQPDRQVDQILNRARGAPGDFDSGVFSSDDKEVSDSRGEVNYILRSSETVTEESETNSVFDDYLCDDQVFLDGEENPAYSSQFEVNIDPATSVNFAKYELVKDSPDNGKYREIDSTRETDDTFGSRVGSTFGGVVIKRGSVSHIARHLNRKSSLEGLCPSCGLANSTILSESNCCEIEGEDIDFSSKQLVDELFVIDSFRKLRHVQDITTLSGEVKKNSGSRRRGASEVKENICRCGYLGQGHFISDRATIHLSENMDRGRNLTSIAYERDLAERTAHKPTRQELIRKQTLVKKTTERKSGIAKSLTTGAHVENKDHHGNHVTGSGKGSSVGKTSGEEEIVRQQVFHTQSPVTTFSGVQPGTPEETRRKRIEQRQHSLLRHETLDHEGSAASASGTYVTPLKKSQMEVKELRNEVSQLSHVIEEKNQEITSLQISVKAIEDKEKQIEEKDRQIAELEARITDLERQLGEEREPVTRLQEELAKMDERYTALKVEFAEKEAKFETYLMDMYKKGLEAARFEREEELEMLAKNSKSRVTVGELTRKLSRTEMELAKWQGLRLGESYFNSEIPRSEVDVTLGFIRDSFLHFLSDNSENHEHLRAILKIFKYSDAQLGMIWKGLENFKNIDRKKVMDKIEVPKNGKKAKK